VRELGATYDDDDLQRESDQIKDQDQTPPHPSPPSSSFAALHARAWRGLQALGFVDVPHVIARHGVGRVVMALNWMAANPRARNPGGLLRTLLDSDGPIPLPPSACKRSPFDKRRRIDGPLSGRYRDKVQR